MDLYCLHRSYSKSNKTLAAPNLIAAPLAPPVHPRDSHTSGRGPAAISRLPQELHNGDAQPAAKISPSCTAEDMDTDGEIDVGDCDDREYHPSPRVCNNPEKHYKSQLILDTGFTVTTCITQ